jgi:glycosyltransferase involved in cell wall biosynthesis
MKKVLHFITGLEYGGGAENMLLQTLPYLGKTENRACALRGRGEVGRRLEKKGVKVYYLEMKNIFDWRVVLRYRMIIKKYKPDIQVNYLIHADFFGRILAKMFGVKKVVSYIREKYINKLHFYLDKLTLFRVDYLLANSISTLDIYQKKLNFSKKKSMCISNGINLDIVDSFIYKKELRKELGLSKEDFVIMCVARLHPVKDHKTLINAISEIHQKNIDNIKLLLVGGGRLDEELRTQVKDQGLEDKIFFLGNRSDVYDLLNISNIFVLPSEREGMSNAILEAMTMSLPCIVATNSGNEELIIDNINGFHFGFGNEKDLAEKILYLFNNKESREKMGKNGRKIIEDKYNIKRVLKEFDNFLENF